MPVFAIALSYVLVILRTLTPILGMPSGLRDRPNRVNTCTLSQLSPEAMTVLIEELVQVAVITIE